MNKDRSDIIIEGNTATWDLHVEGIIGGTHSGKFRFRCFLTPTQKITASRKMREMLGPQMTMAPEHESFLAYAITQLEQRILSAPPFWSANGVGGDIPDENVITEVLNAAIDAEIKYSKQLSERKKDALERAKIAAEKILSGKDRDSDEDGGEDET